MFSKKFHIRKEKNYTVKQYRKMRTTVIPFKI